MKLDLNKVSDLQLSGLDDYPDFADLFIESGTYGDRDLTEEEMDFLQDECSDWVYEQALNQLF